MVPRIFVIIPAFNEALSISGVLNEIPKSVYEVIVVDNASTDHTAAQAIAGGATVLTEPEKGYGAACLNGIRYVGKEARASDIIVFLDGDFSDYPAELPAVVSPILNDNADMVIGSRVTGNRQSGALLFHQRAGNRLATTLIKYLYGQKYTDLGPFRAIRWESLVTLDMQDRTFGWTVEMQVKAAKLGYHIREVPVSYRKRIGKSKVSGTLYGTVMASYKILSSIFKNLL